LHRRGYDPQHRLVSLVAGQRLRRGQLLGLARKARHQAHRGNLGRAAVVLGREGIKEAPHQERPALAARVRQGVDVEAIGDHHVMR
jgi:hypothetical protein